MASHIVFPGHDVVANTTGGICGGAPKDISWIWDIPQGVSGTHGCDKDGTYCSFKAGAPTDAYSPVCIYGGNIQGGWESCDYYAVPGAGEGVIDGYVTNKDGSPSAGVVISAYGAQGANTVTAANGWYAMQVAKGTYRVLPSGGPQGKSAPTYTPRTADVTVTDGASHEADFQLDAGLDLQLHLDSSSVPADGLAVVSGTITTTMFGKPDGGVTVQLEAQPNETYDEAVTSGPRASVCGPNGRVWPSETLSIPSGRPVIVTTDAGGHYNLNITVGTTPGTWSLDAWAEVPGPDGNTILSSDTTAASQTQSLTFAPLGSGVGALTGFASDLNGEVAHNKALTQLTANSDQIVDTLAQVTAARAAAGKFDGLAYALVNAKDGQSVLIFRADRPPVVNNQGELPPGDAANANDLVIDPAEWTGGGLVARLINTGSLEAVLDSGRLPDVPRLADFDAGKPAVGWKPLHGNQVTIFSTSFEFVGWGYAGIAPATACY